MRLRWIKRYKVENTPIKTGGVSCSPTLVSSLTLQEYARNGRNFEWQDIEIYDDLETKELAIEELQKRGVHVPLRVRD